MGQDEVDALIGDIVARTRNHPDIVRGASVRGSLAFKELVQGFLTLEDALSEDVVEKAALVALAGRITTREGGRDSAVAVIKDIVKEVLYGVHTPGSGDGPAQPSQADFKAAARRLKPQALSAAQEEALSQKSRAAIASKNNLRLSSTPRGMMNQMRRPKSRAVDDLLEELEKKRQRGEISEEDYRRTRAQLEEMLGASMRFKSEMSGKDMAETVMQIMDAKDNQWSKDVSLEQIFVYYHVKSTTERMPLENEKQNWHTLKILLDHLEQRGVLRSSESRDRFTLTAGALDSLLDTLLDKARRGRELRGIIRRRSSTLIEREHDTRHYHPGDVFRDISVRHTLREIARRRKQLSEVDRRDFRVYLKQPRRLQPDLVLCVDSSGSMGFRHKLTFARLAAAGLARAVLEKGGRVGIVSFDDFGRNVLALTEDRQQVFNYLAAINAGGNTNVGDGVRCATKLLLSERSRNEKYIILVTDGLASAVSEESLPRLTGGEEDLAEEDATVATRKALVRGIKTSVVHISEGKEVAGEFIRNLARVGRGQVRTITCLEDFGRRGGRMEKAK